MRSYFLLSITLLAACNGPGLDMQGTPAQRIEVGRDSFDVRRNGPHMQAIRRSIRALPRIRDVAAGAEAAMEQASGCDVAWLMGDVAVMWGGLSCDGEKPPKMPNARGPDIYVCDVSQGNAPLTLDCTRR